MPDFSIQGQPVNLTDRNGYDNQPFFSPDGRSFFYTSYRETVRPTFIVTTSRIGRLIV